MGDAELDRRGDQHPADGLLDFAARIGSNGSMIPTLAQVCSLPADFASQIEHYAAASCPAIELWLTKLEQFIEHHDVATVQSLLETHAMAAPVASCHGGMFQDDNAGFQDARSLFLRRLELCQSLGIGTLVVAGDIHDPLSQQLLQRVRERLGWMADAAAQANVRIALEFQASATFMNNLETAVALVAETAHPALGICLDTFHFHVGPSKTEDLALLTAENLFHVQLCDLAYAVRELATDQQRILPGEGDVAIGPIVDCLTQMVYSQAVSIETLNPQMWQVSPLAFGQIAMTSLRKALRMERENDRATPQKSP
jgi:2-keto-myo-inositol isomerase